MYKITKKRQHPFLSAGLALLILSASLHASSATKTPTNAAAEIRIQADYMVFDLETGNNVYKGNVRIVQGSIELTGDEVTILRSNDKVRDIDVTGNPARYLQDENTVNIVRAVSQQIHYSAQQNRLVLINEASLEQADHTVESQRIVYDTAKKIVIAGNDSDKKSGSKQRVNITLTPKKDKQKTD